jgi:hypothetical protein
VVEEENHGCVLLIACAYSIIKESGTDISETSSENGSAGGQATNPRLLKIWKCIPYYHYLLAWILTNRTPMTRRREVFAGMTARELRAALSELQELRVGADAMREQLEETRQALYRQIDYHLAWLLREGAHAHAQADNMTKSPPHQSALPQHKTERECDRWQIATLRKIIVFASPEGIDLEALTIMWRVGHNIRTR